MFFRRTLLLFGSGFLFSLTTCAQTTEHNTEWLKNQLNQLVIDDKDKDVRPVFDFKDCLMTMVVNGKEEGIKFNMNMNWPLKEIRKVSYKSTNGGKYTLQLDIPGNKVKGKMKIGFLSKSLRSKGDAGQSTFDLNTTDESLMKAIQEQFESSIRQCQLNK